MARRGGARLLVDRETQNYPAYFQGEAGPGWARHGKARLIVDRNTYKFRTLSTVTKKQLQHQL